jgi:dihydrofolate reductase
MGSIKAGLFISLDGVVEAPHTWHFPYFNDEMGAAVGALTSSTDSMLLGRQTYDEFADYWPSADPTDPFTAQMNDTPKYVVSRTLTEPTWQNTTFVAGTNPRPAIESLKAEHDLGMSGSGTLVRWLLEQQLVDELHLFVHPIVIGSGKKLFGDGATVPLTLRSSTAFSSGTLYLVYGPAATAADGEPGS